MLVNPDYTRKRISALFLSTALGLALFAAPAATAAADPSWNPQASERLVKLPASYLKKSVDQDFAQSELGQALRDTDADIGAKVQTLSDLQAAIPGAEGEVRTELGHQFLAEKREYLKLVSRKTELRRKQLATKQRLIEGLLERAGRDGAEATPAKRELIKAQDSARKRFESSMSQVDVKLLGSSAATESRYSREYAKNVASIETLVRAIQEHPMNAKPEIDGEAVTKQDYLRQMLADAQAELALVDQEGNILGYMAKLVALDAMALADNVRDASPAVAGVPETSLVNNVVNFFVAR